MRQYETTKRWLKVNARRLEQFTELDLESLPSDLRGQYFFRALIKNADAPIPKSCVLYKCYTSQPTEALAVSPIQDLHKSTMYESEVRQGFQRINLKGTYFKESFFGPTLNPKYTKQQRVYETGNDTYYSTFEDCDFRDSTFYKYSFIWCKFLSCDFTDSEFASLGISSPDRFHPYYMNPTESKCELHSCVFDRSVFKGIVNFGNSYLYDCSFNSIQTVGSEPRLYFGRCIIFGCSFENAKLAGANFRSARIPNGSKNPIGQWRRRSVEAYGDLPPHTSFKNADLRGASFHGADMRGVDFEGANLEGAMYDDKTIFSRGLSLRQKISMTRKGQ